MVASLTDDVIAGIVRATAPGTVQRWRAEPVDYPFGSPTSAGAVRLRGESRPGGQWSLFVKVVQAYRHWPPFATLPPAHQRVAAASSMWRYEADVYASDVGKILPDGLRLPAVHGIIDLGDDRLAIVLEDVAATGSRWDTARFVRAADLLGRLGARLNRFDALPAQASRVPGEMTALFYHSRLLIADLPALADDRTWRHPLLAAREGDLRADLAHLAGRIPSVLDRLTRLPQVMTHGDASPQNLLVPADRPDTFVAIDWFQGGTAAVGDDLGQLLVGLAHAGLLGVGDLGPLRANIVAAYTAGLRAEGIHCDEADVRYGLDGGMLLRSTFTALPLDRLAEPLTDALAEHITARLALTRYLADLGLAL